MKFIRVWSVDSSREYIPILMFDGSDIQFWKSNLILSLDQIPERVNREWWSESWEMSLDKKIRGKMVAFKQLLFLAHVLLKSLTRCIHRKKSEEIKTCSSRKKKIFKGKQQSLYSFNDILESYTSQKCEKFRALQNPW